MYPNPALRPILAALALTLLLAPPAFARKTKRTEAPVPPPVEKLILCEAKDSTAILANAIDLARLGERDEALASLDELKVPGAFLGDYALYLEGQWAMDWNRPERAEAAFSAYLDLWPQGPLAEDAFFSLAQAVENQGRVQDAAALLGSLDSTTFSREARSRALLEKGCLLMREGQPHLALASFQEICDAGASSRVTTDALDALVEAKRALAYPEPELPLDTLWSRANAAFDTGHFGFAEGINQEILRRFPQDETAYAAAYQYAMCAYRQDRYEEAAVRLRAAFAYADTENRSYTLTSQLGRALRKHQKNQEAIEVYQAFSAQFPQSRHAGKILYNLGMTHDEMGLWKQGRQELVTFLKEYPRERSLQDDVWFSLAFSDIRSKNWTRAKGNLSALLRRSPRTAYREDALYWLVVCSRNLKDGSGAVSWTEKLLDEYPGSFYREKVLKAAFPGKTARQAWLQSEAEAALARAEQALSEEKFLSAYRWAMLLAREHPTEPWLSKAGDMARRSLGRHKDRMEADHRFLLGNSGFPAGQLIPSDESLAVGSALMALGLRDWGRLEWRRALREDSGNLTLLHTLYSESLADQDQTSALHCAVRLGMDTPCIALAKPLPSASAAYFLPAFFTEEICASSRRFNVEACHLYGTMRAESNFNPRAVSPAAARGLLQLIPATAGQMAGELDMAPFTIDALFLPSVNVTLGASYVRHLLSQFGDRTALATAAYNGGPNQVRSWLGRLPKVFSDEEFIASITYDETRKYVKRVMSFSRGFRPLVPDCTEPGTIVSRSN